MPITLHQFATNLAAALLSDEWSLPALVRRGRRTLTSKPRWLKPLVERAFAHFPTSPRDDHLTRFVEADEQCRTAFARTKYDFKERFTLPIRMWPPTVTLLASPPSLVTVAELAAWLGLTPERLDWYADVRGINTRQRIERLRHYSCRWVPKPGPNPAMKHRLIEAPKPGLKWVQRRILEHVLNLIPPHDAAHGFRTARNVVTNAAPHCGREVVG